MPAPTGTGEVQAQIPRAMPVDANGHPLPMITPGDWGGIRKFGLTLVSGEPLNLIQGLRDQHSDFPMGEMLQLTFWSVLNWEDRDIYVGADDVAEGEDYPVPAYIPATNTPGFHAMKTDPAKVWLLLPGTGTGTGSGEQSVVIHLSGRMVD